MYMSNAKATIESSIIAGLSKRAHITGASIRHADIQVADILDEMFHPSVVWAVREYLKEIGQYEDQQSAQPSPHGTGYTPCAECGEITTKFFCEKCWQKLSARP